MPPRKTENPFEESDPSGGKKEEIHYSDYETGTEEDEGLRIDSRDKNKHSHFGINFDSASGLTGRPDFPETYESILEPPVSHFWIPGFRKVRPASECCGFNREKYKQSWKERV